MDQVYRTAYLNPVYPHSCPDPFVLKHLGEYWCYCTGIRPDGRCFGVLHSADLVHWQPLGGAMDPLPGDATCYWAPEVAVFNGRFYMYYSMGDGIQMQIRVAVASGPQGPFMDSGRRLTSEEFAIDAHVFQDDDGTRYLFYAADFLDYERIGTGTVRDRLLDPFTLAGEPQAVTRARFDWQVYDPLRAEKGGVRWHTLEGPFVLKHKGRYYQMFSGGNWQNISYGVSYAVSKKLETSTEWDQHCDGTRVLPILRTLPELGVIGPGHNSVVRGPDNRQLFCVYHRWVEAEEESAGQPCADSSSPSISASARMLGSAQMLGSARVLAIDRQDWAGDQMVVFGPSSTPQPAPLPASIAYFTRASPDRAQGLGGAWTYGGGDWAVSEGEALQGDPRPGRLSEARLPLPSASFLLEVSLKTIHPDLRNPGAYGLLLDGEGGELFSLSLLPRTNGTGTATGLVAVGSSEQRREQPVNLPADFEAASFHLLRLEVNHRFASLFVDSLPCWEGWLDTQPDRLVLFTRGMGAAFAGLELTPGWQDLFMPLPGMAVPGPADFGWKIGKGSAWEIRDGQLWHTRRDEQHSWLSKGLSLIPGRAGDLGIARYDYELVVNARLESVISPEGGYGFSPALGPGSDSLQPLLALESRVGRWSLVERLPGGERSFSLPDGFDPVSYQQFRFLRQGPQIMVYLQGQVLGEVRSPLDVERVGLYAHRAAVTFDLVRLTLFPGTAS